MNKLNIVLLAVVSAIILSSCSIDHTIDFNKDMSGNMSVEMDMADMLKVIKDLQPDSDMTDEELLKSSKSSEKMIELKEEFEETEGISNFEAIENYDDGILGFRFDFDDIKSINKGVEDSPKDKNKKSQNDAPLFSLSKNKLSINFGDDKQDENEPNPLAAYELGEYKMKLNFPFTIKKVSNPLYTISKDRKSVMLNIELVEMMKDLSKLKTDITW